jgi:hypothetical protein
MTDASARQAVRPAAPHVRTHSRLPGRTGRGIRQLDHCQALKTAVTSEFHGFHGTEHKQVDANALPPRGLCLGLPFSPIHCFK